MIQRIQTLFLFFAAVASALMVFFPILSLTGENGQTWVFNAGNIIQHDNSQVLFKTIPLLVLIIIVIAISLITIFLYKKRIIQVRLTIYNIILLFGVMIIAAMFTWKASLQLDAKVSLAFVSVMPMVSIILNYLAFRAIRRDDILIKGLDRIR